jgi:hemerythrin
VAFYTWKDAFLTGIDQIDRQHRAFFDLLNACHEAARADGGGTDASLRTSLKRYASVHFRFEEDLLRAAGCPHIDVQVRQHAFFEAQLGRLDLPEAQSGRPAREMLSFLRDWFLEHILTQDMQALPFVQANVPPGSSQPEDRQRPPISARTR